MKNNIKISILILIIFLLPCCAEKQSEKNETAENKTEVMILGTFHFAEKGSHMIDLQSENILSNKKQNELKEVRLLISRFKPTKIAVEVSLENDGTLSELYQHYLKSNKLKKNDIISESNEVYQLSFSLAKEFNHKKLYAIDKKLDLPTEVFEYAEKNNKPYFNEFMSNLNHLNDEMKKIMKNDSILDVLRYLNDNDEIDSRHSNFFLSMVNIGSGQGYEGVDFLTAWYRRNFYIFSNLKSIAHENDRILVIYGTDHSKILKELVNDCNEMELIDSNDYLF